MEQERIDWTLQAISRLKEEGIGDEKKLNDIKYQLENNFQVTEKDSGYLKKHYEILEKREEKEREKTCARCQKKLGFMKYNPKEYHGIKGKICGDCITHIGKNHISFEGKYIEGTLDLKEGTGIQLHLNSFDDYSIAISSKKQNFLFPVNNLESFQNVELERESMKKKIITAGLKDKIKSDTMELKFDVDGTSNRILLKMKDHDRSIESIFSIKKGTEIKDKLTETNDNESKPVTFADESQEHSEIQSIGRIIKQTPTAQYYGGHKAYIAGGTFGDAQNGVLILTEKYLIFNKNAMRESKRWQIKIPLDKVVLGDWKIDEKVRRKTMAGGGAALGFGFFGGGGTIHDTGKAHDIVVPYVDENGIEQAPRFGVSSLTGNAIREWAKLIYDVLVVIQKEKNKDVENQEITESKTVEDDPLKILKLRLAKGEITKEEFEELKGLMD